MIMEIAGGIVTAASIITFVAVSIIRFNKQSRTH
jgi:hypothetical protein